METDKERKETTLSNRERAEAKQEFIDSLVAGCQSEQDLFGPDGVFTRLKGAVMERLLEAEMAEHLGTEKGQRRTSLNSRNGFSPKTVQTDTGPVEIRVPRDREGSFEPKLVKKRQRRLALLSQTFPSAQICEIDGPWPRNHRKSGLRTASSSSS
jgi:hypothetical protein